MRLAPVVVFFVVLAGLSLKIQDCGVASGFTDPLARIGAQDEAWYGSEAIAMATGGGWLTQTMLHRWEMSKPPLLMWLTALAFKIAGISRVALRAPTLLCGALIAALLCAIVRNARGTLAGWAAALLIAGNPLLFTLARHNLTDILVAAAATLAITLFLGDTGLTRRRTLAGLGIAVAASILAKSLMGLLLWLILGLASLCLRREERPSPARLAAVGAIACLLAGPWFCYQLARHHDFFLAEMNVIFGQARGVKPQQTQEGALEFYAARLALLDPVLAVLAATALLGFWRALRRRDSAALSVLCWITVFGAVLLGFRFRSAPYLLPVLPAFVLLGALWSPLFSRRAAGPLLALLIAWTAVKAGFGDRPWGLPVTPSHEIASARPLQRYCEMRRATDLILFDAGDQFYGATLPLAHVRYVWIENGGQTFALNPHLHYLGILLSAAEFEGTPAHLDAWQHRMRAWGMTDYQAAGSGIAIHGLGELQAMVDARAGSDFFLPAGPAASVHSSAHERVAADAGYVYLLARRASGEYQPGSGWSCRF